MPSLRRPLRRPFAPVRRALIATGVVASVILAAAPAWADPAANPNKTWGTNGRIEAMVTVGATTYIGGTFTQVVDTSGHSHPAANLAAVDTSSGVVDQTWKGSTNGEVSELAAEGTTLYVGGKFTTVSGSSHKDIAAIDSTSGQALSAFQGGANNYVDAITADGSSIYIGGRFTQATGGGSFQRSFLAKMNAVTGAVDSQWSPAADLRVYTLAQSSDGNTIYAGGMFTMINGQPERMTVALSASGSGSPLPGYKGDSTNNRNYAPVFDMVDVGNTLYLAVAGGGGACVAFNGTTGKKIWSKHTNGNVQAVVYLNGEVYCGGHFGGDGSFDGQTRYKMGAVNATAPYNTTDFAPRFNSALGIWAMSVDSNHLSVGGDFSQVNNAKHAHLAIFDD